MPVEAKRAAVYAGSFDPITLGHLNVIERSSRLVDELIVGVGTNIDKESLFNVEERVELVERVTRSLGNVVVRPFSGLAVQFVRDCGALVIIRGVRSLSDMDSEFTMTLANAALQPPFAELLGIKITHISPERVTAELPVREEFNNRHGILHGGAIMAFADNLGGTATTANLTEGQTTTTIESKTNFFAAIPIGDVARAECTPLHRGRTTMVWQTRITRGDGKLAAIVTQTQLVLSAR